MSCALLASFGGLLQECTYQALQVSTNVCSGYKTWDSHILPEMFFRHLFILPHRQISLFKIVLVIIEGSTSEWVASLQYPLTARGL
jgi:lysophospholipid acyltransferase (LPLAT)-like uncharacterized protein